MTWRKGEVAAFNSVMRSLMKGNSRMNCKNSKKLTVFLLLLLYLYFKERLNGNMNLVVEFSVVTFEHVFINQIL